MSIKDSVRSFLVGKILYSSQVSIYSLDADHSGQVTKEGKPRYTNAKIGLMISGLTWEEFERLRSEFQNYR